jgi:hypothetical protein
MRGTASVLLLLLLLLLLAKVPVAASPGGEYQFPAPLDGGNPC